MRRTLRNSLGLLAFAAFALAACSGGGPMTPQGSSANFTSPAATRTITVKTIDTSYGKTKNVPNVPVKLWSCKPNYCFYLHTVIAKGITDKTGSVKLTANFPSDREFCAVGTLHGSNLLTCPKPFPDSVVIDFGMYHH